MNMPVICQLSKRDYEKLIHVASNNLFQWMILPMVGPLKQAAVVHFMAIARKLIYLSIHLRTGLQWHVICNFLPEKVMNEGIFCIEI